MKKSFMKFATMFASAMFVLAACEKAGNDDTDKGNGGLKNPEDGGETELPASLSGSGYYVISLGTDEYNLISDKVVLDLMPYDIGGDATNPGIGLFVWEGTYSGGTPVGTNFYGYTSGGVSLVAGNAGWTGAAYNITQNAIADRADLAKITDIQKEIDKYYLHFAYKTEQRGVAQLITLNWNGASYVFAVGEGSTDQYNAQGQFVKTHNAIAPTSGAFVLGDWNEYEIPLAQTGLDYSTLVSDNYFQFSSGATAGTTIDLDAIFFYKK